MLQYRATVFDNDGSPVNPSALLSHPLRQMAPNFEQFQTRIRIHVKLTIETMLETLSPERRVNPAAPALPVT